MYLSIFSKLLFRSLSDYSSFPLFLVSVEDQAWPALKYNKSKKKRMDENKREVEWRDRRRELRN